MNTILNWLFSKKKKFVPDPTKFWEYEISIDTRTNTRFFRIYDVDAYQSIYRCNVVERGIPFFNPRYALTLDEKTLKEYLSNTIKNRECIEIFQSGIQEYTQTAQVARIGKVKIGAGDFIVGVFIVHIFFGIAVFFMTPENRYLLTYRLNDAELEELFLCPANVYYTLSVDRV